jgi:hypothetical protein
VSLAARRWEQEVTTGWIFPKGPFSNRIRQAGIGVSTADDLFPNYPVVEVSYAPFFFPFLESLGWPKCRVGPV